MNGTPSSQAGSTRDAASPLLCPVCGSERVPVEVSEGRVCCANRECPAYAVPVDADLAEIDFKGLLTAYEKMVADGEGAGS